MVALSHVYIDESGTHGGSPILTMGGYLFRSEQAQRFSREWSKELLRLGLPFAHMTDCANGNGNYANMPLKKRIDSEKRLIEHIKRRSVFGFSVSLNPTRYTELLDGEPGAPTAYTFALMGCLTVVRRWVARTSYNGKVAYFFEAGHEHQSEANLHLNDLMGRGEEAMARVAYMSHAFVDKRHAPPLQAADMLAWQYHHYHCRRLQGHNAMRKDFAALIRKGDVAMDYLDANLLEFRDAYLRENAQLKEAITTKGMQSWPQWPGKPRSAS